jgi:hypothetical protein
MLSAAYSRAMASKREGRAMAETEAAATARVTKEVKRMME